MGANFESAAARRDERERFDALAEFENFCRQTDGFRRVVSNHAVFDRHFGFHLELLSSIRLARQGNPVKKGTRATRKTARRKVRGANKARPRYSHRGRTCFTLPFSMKSRAWFEVPGSKIC
jgi:hypothetical protein